MAKMKLNLMNALKSTLLELASHTESVLVYGEDAVSNTAFCHPINILRNRLRFLACTHLEIRGLGYYSTAQSKIVEWLKQHIRKPTNGHCWWSLTDSSKWLQYNIASDLYILKLQIAKVSYYIVLRDIYLVHFRSVAFKYTN